MKALKWAIGMMSGTSMDGIAVAAIKTDGEEIFEKKSGLTVSYSSEFRDKLRGILGQGTLTTPIASIEKELTELHAHAFFRYLEEACILPTAVKLIGFHGHTIFHQPPSRFSNPRTWQIGDGQLLSQLTKTDVVFNMRENDVKHGGEGAPLVPLYHRALAHDLKKPVAIINIGGISNVTWIGHKDQLLAFDMGPGNALLDDWVKTHYNIPYDKDGLIAARGVLNKEVIKNFSAHPYFRQNPPKSLDRLDFNLEDVRHLPPEDALATLTEMTAIAIKEGTRFFSEMPHAYIITGGGRLNKTLMGRLAVHLAPAHVQTTEEIGWDGDYIESEAFAFLAVRATKGLPLSEPTTTGVKKAVSGGAWVKVDI
jgi:anhydro-N-acetylmuramic acid kinase